MYKKLCNPQPIINYMFTNNIDKNLFCKKCGISKETFRKIMSYEKVRLYDICLINIELKLPLFDYFFSQDIEKTFLQLKNINPNIKVDLPLIKINSTTLS